MTSPPTPASPVSSTMLQLAPPTDAATEKTFTTTLAACLICWSQKASGTRTPPTLSAPLPITSQAIPGTENLNRTRLTASQRDTVVTTHITTPHKDLITVTACTVTMLPMTRTWLHTTLMAPWGQQGTILHSPAACSRLRASRRLWWLNT